MVAIDNTFMGNNLMEAVRTAVRPALLFLLGMGTLVMILEGISGEFADWWMRLFLVGAAEWIIERPALKLAKKA